MKIENKNKQKELLNEIRKFEKEEKAKSTHQAPLIPYYETIPLRIKTEQMTARECERLKRITARDTRIIRHYLRIIKHNKEKRVLDKGKLKPLVDKKGEVNKGLLDKLTLTTYTKNKNKLRTSVPHDLKKRYPRCSVNEFQECRDKAIWTYESWRKTQERSKTDLNRPQFKKKTPRPLFPRTTPGGWTVRIHLDPDNTTARIWLELRDSLDSKRSDEKNHKRLWLPLAYSPYHEKKLKLEKTKRLELVYESKEQRWWAHFVQHHSVPSYQSTLPPAVLGVDLGIKKTAVAVLLNPTGKVIMDELRFIVNKERQAKIYRLGKRIQSIQRELDTRKKNGQPQNQLNVTLSQLRRRLRSVTKQELGYAVNQLVNFILQLKKRFNLFISIGYPKDIRKSHQRGSGNKSLRRQLHKWCYRLFITKLKHKLAKQGFESHRVVAIDESWTSKTCSRCFSINTTRTKQGLFNCNYCNYELNADLNGARNIGKRLIQYALEPNGEFKEKNILLDTLSGDFHSLDCYQCFHPLSQWLKYSSGDTSFL